MDALRVAVVGTGSAGMHHLRALRVLEGVRPVAVPLRPARRPELEGMGFETAESLAQAARLGAKACVVATDTLRHMRDASEALSLGMDVLVEKPMAPEASQVREAWRPFSGSGRKVFVGCVLRFSKSLNRFRELLVEIGPVHSVGVECRSFLPDWRPQRPYRQSYSARAEEGGVLRDLIHEIDYAGWTFGWPEAAYGLLGSTGRLGIEAEEWAELVWETPASAVVSVGLDYLTPAPRRRMCAAGERGTLEWDVLGQTVTLSLGGRPPSRETLPEGSDALFVRQAEGFVEVLRGGRNSRLASLEDGFRALAVCDAVRASSDTHRREVVQGL
ncbi:MAG TPA: hypothetical protein DCM05_02600 [Elusimicrobia bacterium]|nr:hypothetical protein [Elusimicrobiota bacterium]